MVDAPAAPPSPAEALPHASEFVLDVLAAASAAPYGTLSWMEINRLAARWLRPASGNASQLGHAVVLEMAERGLVEAEVTQMADGSPIVARVLHPRIFGLQAARELAA